MERSGNLNPMWGRKQSLETKQKSVILKRLDMPPLEKQLLSEKIYSTMEMTMLKLEETYCDTCLIIMIYALIM